MQQYEEAAYYGDYPIAAEAADSARGAFLKRTYAHLAAAIAVLVGVEIILFKSGFVDQFFAPLVLGKPFMWIVVFGVYMLVSHIAHRWAASNVSTGAQYVGLGVYILCEALILAPLLFIANHVDPTLNILGSAVLITLLIFGGLTGFVLVTGKDFSFLGGALTILGFAALGVMICSWIFGFTLGIVFVVAMIVLMSGYILYHTSVIQRSFPVNKHVAASIALLASIVTLFWYVLQLLMYLQSDD